MEWIKKTHSLPENEGFYLVLLISKSWRKLLWDGEEFVDDNGITMLKSFYTHWMTITPAHD